MGGTRTCDQHVGRQARFTCMSCDIYACEDCSRHVWVKDHFDDLCLKCGRPYAAVSLVASSAAINQTTHDRGPGELVGQLGAIVAFTFRRSTLLMMLGLALIIAPLYWAISGFTHPALALLGLLLILTIEASVYFRIVLKSAFGQDDIDPPDASDLALDLFAPAAKYLMTLVPMIVAVLWWADQATGTMWAAPLFFLKPSLIADFPGPATLLTVGLVLWPLTTVGAAMGATFVEMFSPVAWLSNLRILGSTYVVGAVGFYAIVAAQVFAIDPLLRDLQAEIDIWGVTTVTVLFLSYLPLAMRGRLLGLMVEPYLGVD